MKINAKLLLLTFTIVVLISVSSAIAYFSLTNKIINNQNNQSVLNAANDFIFTFQQVVENLDVEFKLLTGSYREIEDAELENSGIDFIFTLKNETEIDFNNFSFTDRLNIRSKFLTVSQFLEDNPNIILKYDSIEDQVYYYGKVISPDLLNELSEKIRANIVLVVDGAPAEFSNEDIRTTYLPVVFDAMEDLRFKNQFDIFSTTFESSDIYASLYTPANILTTDSKLGFLIFQSSAQAAEFRYTSGVIILILIVSGAGLSLILILLFTSKLRKQISELNYAVKVTSKGNLNYRVKLISKDEIGNFGNAFNNMLDELQRQKTSEKEYSEFITLINRNPSLKEIAEAAINKIIKSTGVSFGILYQVENNEILKPLASYGIKKSFADEKRRVDYYQNAIENREIIEFNFTENYPVIKTGLAEIKVKYILIVPMIYADEVVAIIELASEHKPGKDVKSYILNIREQLAVGIINGAGFEKLSRLVDELKKLNDSYQNQNRELRELHIELKHKAEELNKQRLKALEAANLKSQFLANITHELKSPLNSILGLSDLIQNDESVSSNNRNRLKVIVRNSKRLLNLINNILEYSRAEAGKIVLKEEQFSLSHFIGEICSFIKPSAEDKGLEFILEQDESLSILLQTDKGKLEQIIVNLLNNAVKFTEEGYVKLKISFPQENDIQFDVIDTGIGISRENREIIFEEFRQADGTTSRQFDGTGLGLSICKKFVDILNGKFSVESEIDHGSKFTVLLYDVIKEKTSTKSEIESSFNQKNILLVSPHNQAHKLYGDYFTLNNAAAKSAFNYSEAKSEIEHGELKLFDAVIVNNILDDNSGWNLLTELKTNRSTLPIIIKTLDPENNYGYALAVYDYIVDTTDLKLCESILERIETNSPLVYSLSRHQDLNSCLKEKYNLFIIENSKPVESILFELSKNKPDILFVDLLDKNEIAVKVIDAIKHNRETRSINIIATLPAKLSNEQIAYLDKELNMVLRKHKHHTLDVLKIFRNRLGFTENKKLKSKLMKEEIHERPKLAFSMAEPGINVPEDKLKVLVVDDDNDALFTVGEIIKNLGYEPVFAKNGVECLLTLNHMAPDLILLDIMMPKMDGFETIKEIKKLENRRDVPVVALTAYAMLEDKDIIERNGFNDIITKPINSAELSLKIRRVLGE